MKRNKLLIPITSIATLTGLITPMTSCAAQEIVVETYTVSLYANEGSFANNAKILLFNNIQKDTKLGDVVGYKEPTLTGKSFACWTDADGNILTADSLISTNILLQANFDDVIAEPVDFETDSWATVVSVCNKGFIAFANAYCLEDGQELVTNEDEAMWLIKQWIYPEFDSDGGRIYDGLIKTVDLNFGGEPFKTQVRLIGINHDIDSTTHEKAKFTFGFVDAIDVAAYDVNGNGMWYTPATSTQEERSCFLRRYLNESLIDTFPIALRQGIKTVEKDSPIYNLDDGSTSTIIRTNEKLFPLSLEETNLPLWFVIFLLSNVVQQSNSFSLNAIDNSAGAYDFYRKGFIDWGGDQETFDINWLKILYSGEFDMDEFKGIYELYSYIYLNKFLLNSDLMIPLDYWVRTGGLETNDEMVPGAFAIYLERYPYLEQFAAARYWNIACPGGVEDVVLGVSPAFCL